MPINKRKFWNIALIFFLALFTATAILLICIFKDYLFLKKDLDDYKNESSNISSEEILPENPIDFASLQEINSEIYAWIRIPNTNIDYPVAQSATDDGFYLHHDIYGKYVFAGTIYTEMQNRKDFSDPNTILYGHNMSKGYMFQNLYKFQKEDFFESNREFYIYTLGHILTYTVFSAYQYDDRHILNSFDFSNEEVFASYLESAKNPTFMLKNVRHDINVTTKDKIVTLSTCLGDGKKYRYLVQGVLTNDQPTK